MQRNIRIEEINKVDSQFELAVQVVTGFLVLKLSRKEWKQVWKVIRAALLMPIISV